MCSPPSASAALSRAAAALRRETWLGEGTGHLARIPLLSPWQRRPQLCQPPWHIPALGHGVPVVDVALERQGHLLLELVDEVPLGDAGMVWGCRVDRRPSAGPRGCPAAAVPTVPTWREEQHGLEQDVLSFVQLQLLQADVELEQWLQVDLLETSWGECGGDGRARMGTWLSPASRCHHSPPPLTQGSVLDSVAVLPTLPGIGLCVEDCVELDLADVQRGPFQQ